jgi:hypothetical protein
MFLCLRIDLDYVPWDTPDAEAYGHGEPAMVLRLLDLARNSGHRYHFFSSNRVLRAFPATAETVLNEGHDLDWFCKHPTGESDRRTEADKLFEQLGHKSLGLCVRGAWPETDEDIVDTTGLQFLSAAPGPAPQDLVLFPVEARPPREAARAGLTARAWTDATKSLVRDCASRRRDLTVSIRPQVLAKFDAKLSHVKEILDIGTAAGMSLKTLRQVMLERS